MNDFDVLYIVDAFDTVKRGKTPVQYEGYMFFREYDPKADSTFIVVKRGDLEIHRVFFKPGDWT